MSGSSDRRGALGTLFRYEIKMLLRDRRMLLVSVIVPLALLPAMIFISRWATARQEAKLQSTTLEYAVTGSQAAFARSTVREALVLRGQQSDSTEAPAIFAEKSEENPDSVLGAGGLHLVVEGLTAAEWDSIQAEETEATDSALADVGADTASSTPAESVNTAEEMTGSGQEGVPVLRLLYRNNSQASSRARNQMRQALRDLRESRRGVRFREAGFPLPLDSVAPVEEHNTASAQKEAGAMVGQFGTLFIVMLMLTGGSIIAADAISGEKERGTLETILTTAARRWEIVGAKQLAIVAVGVTITVINLANLLIWVGIGIIDLPDTFRALTVTPLGMGVLVVLFVPLAVLISAVLLLASGYAKTYKEFQVYFLPIYLLSLLPAAAAFLPGIKLRSVVSVVPIANVSVAVHEVLQGNYDWPFLLVTLLATGAVATWASRLTSRTLSTERLITAAELDRAELLGGPELFPRRVLRWFATMWALILIISVWWSADTDIRTQVAFNLLGVFLVSIVLMIRRYRLDFRKALALRPVRPEVWLAVLIGAPSALVLASEVFRLANLIFPVPEQTLESFGQFMLPETIPLWQIVFFLCVLPGIVEELTFRGMLLYGLRKRFHPVVLCLVVGGIFGLFHVSLFRLVPVAYLGTILAAVTLLTGSIFPAMLWHALNNASSLVPAYLDLPVGELPRSMSLVALAGLALSFWILWRSGDRYPGLRGSDEGQPPEA